MEVVEVEQVPTGFGDGRVEFRAVVQAASRAVEVVEQQRAFPRFIMTRAA